MTSRLAILLFLGLAACQVTTTSGTGGEGAAGGGTTGGTATGGTTGVTTGGSTGGPEAVAAIAARGDDTCILGSAGHVACWGNNETGQLGMGDFHDRRVPTWMPGVDGITQLGLGDGSLCALRGDGTVWCVGMNYYGELGTETDKCPGLGYPCSWVPVQAEVSGATAIGGGRHFGCATDAGGGLTCWGSSATWNGDGYAMRSSTGGEAHGCGLFTPPAGADPNRNVVCWGRDALGQRGDGDGASPGVGVGVVDHAGAPFVEVAAGDDFTCGVTTDHAVYCWGANWLGSLGVGVGNSGYPDYPETCPDNGACSTRPVQLGLPPVAHVAASFAQACAVTTGGEVYCWGVVSHTSPASAGVCNPTADSSCQPTPTLVAGVPSAVQVAAGNGHACALTANGEVWCWGLDTHGQLGHGPGGPSFDPTPTKVSIPPVP